MYGWRARIGLIIAHSNTTMEPEFARVAPKGVSIHTARVPVGERSLAGLSHKDEPLEQAVKLISDLNAKSYAYACTAINMIPGDEGDIAQAKKIIAMTGRPAIPASIALVEALTALGARRIAIATVLPPELNEITAVYWKNCGFEVSGVGGINLGGARQPAEPFSSVPISSQGLQTPAVVYNMGRSVYRDGVDAVVISGANLGSIDIADAFERDFGVPLISSGIAIMWAALQAAGVRESIPGCGCLLAQQPPLKWARLPRP